MRRRLRKRKREREARLLDLGALVYELHRQGKRAPELLQEKAAELAVVDEEVRGIEATLEGVAPAPPANGAHPPDYETHEADALEEPEADDEPAADDELEADELEVDESHDEHEEHEGEPVDHEEERA